MFNVEMVNVHSSGQSPNDDSERIIWCAGLTSLSRPSNQTNERVQQDQMDQIPATRRETVSKNLDCPRFVSHWPCSFPALN